MRQLKFSDLPVLRRETILLLPVHHKFVPHQKKYLDLVNWLEQNQSKLVPTFPGIEDENMQTHFTLQTEKNISDAALKDLQNLAGIKGAYRKPEDSLPG